MIILGLIYNGLHMILVLTSKGISHVIIVAAPDIMVMFHCASASISDVPDYQVDYARTSGPVPGETAVDGTVANRRFGVALLLIWVIDLYKPTR